jgi:hypothetical protein
MLAENGLCIIPRILSRVCEERTTQKGNALFYVTVEAEYDLVAAKDGSKHTAKVFGEAMDSADKATNKAMSAAYKYMAFQTFAIPTEGDNDADSVTHSVAPAKKPPEPYDYNKAFDDMAEAVSLPQLQSIFAPAYRHAQDDGNTDMLAEVKAKYEYFKAKLAANDAKKAPEGEVI